MSEADEPIHGRLVSEAQLPANGTVVDLGCGSGPTLAAFARRLPGARLVGLDRSAPDAAAARTALSGHRGATAVAVADLRRPLPLRSGCADAVVSYNVLECLPDPLALLAEAARLLRPGGRAVLAHVDFDTIVVAGPERELDRRICHAFTDDRQPWMDHADGRIGRRLPGLVRLSPLVPERVRPWVTNATELTGAAARRVEGIRHALTGAAARGSTAVTSAEVHAWHSQVLEAADSGRVFFAETAMVVTAVRA
ncbi:methyltransferase domain-containing protein [Kitasatospora sp. NPDC059571]|uniref:methyltransferase domain-containing protein n=1 Tax=Kitasatospora sp. NPDC059571 TaxID=3346871 RepID=UPI0036AB9E65